MARTIGPIAATISLIPGISGWAAWAAQGVFIATPTEPLRPHGPAGAAGAPPLDTDAEIERILGPTRGWATPPSWQTGERAYGPTSHGNCMSPLFEDGDVGIVDPAWPIRVGDMVEIKFKKFGDIDTKLLPMMKRLIEPLPPPHEWDENHMVVVEALNPSARWSCTLDLIESVYRVRGPVIPLPNPGFEHWNPVAVRRHIETLERLLNSPANETSEADAETLRTVQAGYREFLELIGQKCIAPADR